MAGKQRAQGDPGEAAIKQVIQAAVNGQMEAGVPPPILQFLTGIQQAGMKVLQQHAQQQAAQAAQLSQLQALQGAQDGGVNPQMGGPNPPPGPPGIQPGQPGGPPSQGMQGMPPPNPDELRRVLASQGAGG